MKKILIFNLIFTLLLSFIPSGNAQAFFTSNASNITPSVTGGASLGFQTIIKVNPIPNNQKIILSQPSLSVACKVSNLAQAEKDLVQTVANLNLNQPADCFSIKPAAPVAMVMTLAVKSLEINIPKIVVVVPTQKFEASNLLPAPIDPQRLPILPSVMFVLGIMGVSLKNKVFQRLAKFKLNNNLVHNANGLQILRC